MWIRKRKRRKLYDMANEGRQWQEVCREEKSGGEAASSKGAVVPAHSCLDAGKHVALMTNMSEVPFY